MAVYHFGGKVALNPKSPNSVLDYSFNWEQWLSSDEVITGSAWSATPDDELAITNNHFSDSETVVWLSGGIVGRVYLVTNTVQTSQGRTELRSFSVKVDIK